LVAFLLSIVLAVVIARTVTQPLTNVARASEAMARGQYEQSVPLEGPDEVSRVADSFNKMASQVANSQQAQRDFVANVSHDLKTPITSILGWSQSLVDGTASEGEQQRRAASVIHDETARLERMVNQLLDLARLESGQLRLLLEQVDLEQLLIEIQQNFDHRTQEAGIGLSLNIQPVPRVMADRDRMSQILTNLMDNALTHTQTGGQIRLGLHPFGEAMVEIAVQDTGRGIPPEELSRIFERFYQVDKSRSDRDQGQGSGLGLSIVKELVEAHQGKITAQSQIGMGTTFIIHLPTVAQNPTNG
jgi:signal transduction histidine kinase